MTDTSRPADPTPRPWSAERCRRLVDGVFLVGLGVSEGVALVAIGLQQPAQAFITLAAAFGVGFMVFECSLLVMTWRWR